MAWGSNCRVYYLDVEKLAGATICAVDCISINRRDVAEIALILPNSNELLST